MLSKLKHVISDEQHSSLKHIEQNNVIQENKLLFQNDPKVKNTRLTCESIEDNSTGCNDFQKSDISPITPQKKLKGAYARSKKNSVQKAKPGQRLVKSSAKIKNPIKAVQSCTSSKDDSLMNSPIKPNTNSINSQTYVQEKKTSDGRMSLMDLLRRYSKSTFNFDDLPVPKSLEECNSQTKKCDEKAVISTQSSVNSHSFLKTEDKNKKESTKVIKNTKKKGNLSIKSKKQLKSKSHSIIPCQKNVKTPRNEPTHTAQIKSSSSMDKSLTNVSDSSQVVAASSMDKSLTNVSDSSQVVAASVENTSVSNVQNNVTIFSPITLNFVPVYNVMQINPFYIPYSLIPTSAYLIPATPSSSQIVYSLNNNSVPQQTIPLSMDSVNLTNASNNLLTLIS